MGCYKFKVIAGWSSQVARRAHNPKVTGSNPVPATNDFKGVSQLGLIPFVFGGVFDMGVLSPPQIDEVLDSMRTKKK